MSISNASIFKFKFQDLEKAQKLYPTDPVKAHEIIDNLIKHYEKKPPKDFPWLAYAYGDKANWLKDEGKEKASLDYRKKSCKLHQQKYKKQKKIDGDGNLIFCYYMLSITYDDLKLFKESIETSTKAISIFEKYENFRVNKFNGPTELNYQIFQRARVYEATFQYDKSIKDYKRLFELKKTPDKNNKRETQNYVSAASSLSMIYGKKGDRKNEFKYTKFYYDSVYQFMSDDPYRLGSANVSMGNYYNSIKNSELAIKHFDEAIKISNKSLQSSNLSYEDKSGMLNHKMTAMVGKNTAVNRRDPDSERDKKLALKLIEMNSEFELLDKRTDGYEYLVDYYYSFEDFDNVSLTYQKIYQLFDKKLAKIKEIKRTDLRDLLKGFVIKDKRRVKFDEAFNYINLNKFQETIKIANELKKYETQDEGEMEIFKKASLLNLYGRVYDGLGDHKKSITYYLNALGILNKAFEKDYTQEAVILNNLALAYLAVGENELAVKYMRQVAKREEKRNIHDINKVTTYSNLAAIIPDKKLAKEYALKAYNIYLNNKEEFRNSMGFINAATILAEFYFAEKKYAEAEKIILSGYEYA